MRKLTRHNQNDLFLAPLGAKPGVRERLRSLASDLPASAGPIAVTLVGGIGLVIVLGALLGSQPSEEVDTLPPVAQLSDQLSPHLDPEEPAASSSDTTTPVVEATAPTSADPIVTAQPAAPLADAFETAQDMEQTSSILSALPAEADLRPTVDVAETDEQVAALEVIQRREVEADVGPAETQSNTEMASAVTMRPAATTNYVNMRSGASEDAEVLLVVPANAKIEAQSDCDWCSVQYDGRSGYIYRTFISYQ